MNLFTQNSPYYHLLKYYFSWNTLYNMSEMTTYIVLLQKLAVQVLMCV